VLGGQQNAHLGSGLISAGDINGDGYSDIVAGAGGYNNGLFEGRLYLYTGSVSGLSRTERWKVDANSQGGLGYPGTFARLGDFNGDGFDDLVTGDANWYQYELSEGRVNVYLGGDTGLSPYEDFYTVGTMRFQQLGAAVSAADTNGDGASDIIAGMDGFSSKQASEGGAQLWLGSPSQPTGEDTDEEETEVSDITPLAGLNEEDTSAPPPLMMSPHPVGCSTTSPPSTQRRMLALFAILGFLATPRPWNDQQTTTRTERS